MLVFIFSSLTKAAIVMKHIHTILLLSVLLLVSPVVYATMSLNQNPTKTETPVVTVQKLVLEPTYGQISNSLVKSSSSFSDQSSVISSSSVNSIISSTVASLSSSSSTTNLNISLENLGQSAKSVSSSSKSNSISSFAKSESKPNTTIEAQNQQSSSVSYSSPTEIKVEETITTIEEKKVSPISVIEEVKSEPKAEEPKQAIVSEETLKPKTYHELIDYYCEQYGCNSTQLKRVMRCESTNNPYARNGIHIGLFQFNPNTFRAYAPKAGLVNADIWNAEDQIRVSAYMFANGQAGQWSCK